MLPSIAALLVWYDRNRRSLPWRARPGEAADPYRVWLSEIMLQQTTVAAVIPYFARFLTRFPTLAALAEAPLDEVLALWAGLGYYARARNLHACARLVAQAGGFPTDPRALRALPGIGVYTATAIGAIAFGQPGIPLDGNVERVLARLFAIATPLPAARPALRAAALQLGADPAAIARASDTAQAMFDLGAGICTPANPDCPRCPWQSACAGHAGGIAASLPRRLAKQERPRRFGAQFWLADAAGRVLLRRRPARGLLGGMSELPGTPWRPEPWTRAEAEALAPMAAVWHHHGEISHVFTHFALTLGVFSATVSCIEAEGYLCPSAELAAEALPSVMRKCVALAQQGGPSLRKHR
jgi:A/G-specific adenine glycosylase